MDSLARLRALLPSLATAAQLDSLYGSGQLTGEVTGSMDHLSLNGLVRANDVRLGRESVESIRGTVLLADITKQPTGSVIFGADTVTLVRPSAAVKRIIRATGLTEVFEIVDD